MGWMMKKGELKSFETRLMTLTERNLRRTHRLILDKVSIVYLSARLQVITAHPPATLGSIIIRT